MALVDKLLELNDVKQDIKTAIENKGVDMTGVPFTDYPTKIEEISGGGWTPDVGNGSVFTGATIPLTYKDNGNYNENNYVYKSETHNITITGLDGRATITGNGTKDVLVAFDVSSATSSLQDFMIRCGSSVRPTLEYKGLHAHYGTTVTGCLTFAYTNLMPDGSLGTIGTNYLFIEYPYLPLFSGITTFYNGIYQYQLLNTLIGNITSVGNNFLRGCYSFNQPLDLSGITSVGEYFLFECYSFNQPLNLSSLTSVGGYFMSNCSSFNQPLDLSGITSVEGSLLSNCYTFNQPLNLSSLTSLEGSFLNNCSSFNQPLNLSSLTSVEGSFLNNCYTFNQPLNLSSLTSVGGYFMSNCSSFNQPLDLSGITSVETGFLRDCSSFNQPLNLSSLTSVGTNFLRECSSFNQPLNLSSLTSVGNDFFYNCRSFNQPINLSGITSVGTGFLRDCYSLSFITWNVPVFPTDNNSLGQTSHTKSQPSNGAGIIVYGTERAGLLAALPNRTSTPYRKLIDGGS